MDRRFRDRRPVLRCRQCGHEVRERVGSIEADGHYTCVCVRCKTLSRVEIRPMRATLPDSDRGALRIRLARRFGKR